MRLLDYIQILNRRKWMILTTLFVVLLVVVVGNVVAKPAYETTVTLRIWSARPDVGYYDYYMYSERLRNTYARIITSRPVLEELAQQLGVTSLPRIDAEAVGGTELIAISVKDADPELASRTANALAEIIISREQEDGNHRIEIIEPAVVPKTQSRLGLSRVVPLAIVIGLFAGLGLAFVVEKLDQELSDLGDRQPGLGSIED